MFVFFIFAYVVLQYVEKIFFNHNFNLKFCVRMIYVTAFNVLFVNESLTLFCVVIKTVRENTNFLTDHFIFLIEVFENLFSKDNAINSVFFEMNSNVLFDINLSTDLCFFLTWSVFIWLKNHHLFYNLSSKHFCLFYKILIFSHFLHLYDCFFIFIFTNVESCFLFVIT